MKKFISCNNIINKDNDDYIELLSVLVANPLLIKYYYLNLLIKYYKDQYIIFKLNNHEKKQNIIKNIVKYLYNYFKNIIFLIDITDIVEFDDNIKTSHLNVFEKQKLINNFNNIIYTFKQKIKSNIKYIAYNNA